MITLLADQQRCDGRSMRSRAWAGALDEVTLDDARARQRGMIPCERGIDQSDHYAFASTLRNWGRSRLEFRSGTPAFVIQVIAIRRRSSETAQQGFRPAGRVVLV